MEEMGVKTANVGWQFMGEHEGLAKSANAIDGAIAQQVIPPNSQCMAVSGPVSNLPPRAKDAPGLVVQVLGQVDDGCSNCLMDRVPNGVGRMAQRKQTEIEASVFQSTDLIGDERFRQARISFEDDRDSSTHMFRCRTGWLRAGPAPVDPVQPASGRPCGRWWGDHQAGREFEPATVSADLAAHAVSAP